MTVLERLFARLNPTPSVPVGADLAPTSPLPRTRGRFEGGRQGDMYYDEGAPDYWTTDSTGPLLSSSHLQNPRMHAPLFDIDRSATLCNATSSGQSVRVTMPGLSPRHAARIGRRLVRNRLGWAGFDPMTKLTVVHLNLPAALVPSRTPGHFHLYVETFMNFRESMRLARCLKPILDKQHIQRAASDKMWIVRVNPNV